MSRTGRRANDRARARHSAVRRRAWFASGDEGGPDLARLEIQDAEAMQPGVRVDPYAVREIGLVVGGFHACQVNEPKSH